MIVLSADETGKDIVGGEGDAADGFKVEIYEVAFDGGEVWTVLILCLDRVGLHLLYSSNSKNILETRSICFHFSHKIAIMLKRSFFEFEQ